VVGSSRTERGGGGEKENPHRGVWEVPPLVLKISLADRRESGWEQDLKTFPLKQTDLQNQRGGIRCQEAKARGGFDDI